MKLKETEYNVRDLCTEPDIFLEGHMFREYKYIYVNVYVYISRCTYTDLHTVTHYGSNTDAYSCTHRLVDAYGVSPTYAYLYIPLYSFNVDTCIHPFSYLFVCVCMCAYKLAYPRTCVHSAAAVGFPTHASLISVLSPASCTHDATTDGYGHLPYVPGHADLHSHHWRSCRVV